MAGTPWPKIMNFFGLPTRVSDIFRNGFFSFESVNLSFWKWVGPRVRQTNGLIQAIPGKLNLFS
jgi:hypothetical protein